MRYHGSWRTGTPGYQLQPVRSSTLCRQAAEGSGLYPFVWDCSSGHHKVASWLHQPCEYPQHRPFFSVMPAAYQVLLPQRCSFTPGLAQLLGQGPTPADRSIPAWLHHHPMPRSQARCAEVSAVNLLELRVVITRDRPSAHLCHEAARGQLTCSSDLARLRHPAHLAVGNPGPRRGHRSQHALLLHSGRVTG